MNFSLRTDRRLVRAQGLNTRYLLASFVAPAAPPRAQRLPVNVALVLDRSGSMSGEGKFSFAREAVELALGMLRADDRFTLVVYDERVDVLVTTTRATPEAKHRATEALRTIGPRGATDLCAGWMRGCEQLADMAHGDGVSRALLLTDGLANRGVTDGESLAHHARELRERGIATSTFGVGADFDERLLRDMAHEGGGNFYFIETPVQIPDLLSSELGEALTVVVRGAMLDVELPDDSSAEPLNRYRHSRTGNRLRIELGDLVTGQDVRAVVEVALPPAALGAVLHARATLRGDGLLFSLGEDAVQWTYASFADSAAQERDVDVDREVATLQAARARAEATEYNRVGDYARAGRVVETAADRISVFAGDDPQLREVASALCCEAPCYAAAPMSARDLKSSVFAQESLQKGRSSNGKARRSREPRGS
jgi:Ca-activated chloride channel homolog